MAIAAVMANLSRHPRLVARGRLAAACRRVFPVPANFRQRRFGARTLLVLPSRAVDILHWPVSDLRWCRWRALGFRPAPSQKLSLWHLAIGGGRESGYLLTGNRGFGTGPPEGVRCFLFYGLTQRARFLATGKRRVRSALYVSKSVTLPSASAR